MPLIVLGTFLRGPNWNIFGIYEFWDVHKLEVLNNVNLSEMFWLNLAALVVADGAGRCRRADESAYILRREWLGLYGDSGVLLLVAAVS